MARLIVVGLGPAGPDLVTIGTRDLLGSIETRYLRTLRHPAAVVAEGALSFDHVYDSAETIQEVYSRIADDLLEAAVAEGEVLYAVPGSPVVAEHTVELLRIRAPEKGVDLQIFPALSFVDLAWARLGIDPIAHGVRVIDGQRFSVEAAGQRGPLLVAQCDTVHVLSEIKLVLDGGIVSAVRPDTKVTILHHLGLPDEAILTVPWIEMDRAIEPDHLTSVYLPELAEPTSREIERLADLVLTLRSECPWDRAQTHHSLTRHLIEETYEVIDAIDGLDEEAQTGYEALEEELGDVLFQVVFHARIAAEAGQFTLADVADGVYRKLYQRHPHVFGDVEVETPDDVVRNWEQIKKAEKGRQSVFEGIPESLPALLFALKVRKKSETLRELGVSIPEILSLTAASGILDEAVNAKTLGDALFALVDLARERGIDPEAAMRSAAVRYRDLVKVEESGHTNTEFG